MDFETSFTVTQDNLLGFKGEIKGDRVELKERHPIPRFSHFRRTELGGDVRSGDWFMSEKKCDDGTHLFYKPS